MIENRLMPPAVTTSGGTCEASGGGGPLEHDCLPMPKKFTLSFRLSPDAERTTLEGREAQTFDLLMTTGPRGFTSGEASSLGWARRTSAYIYKLRQRGLPIISEREKTADGAVVVRYTLTAPFVLIERLEQAKAK